MSKDNKAQYYDHGGIETLDIIKAKLTHDQFEGFMLGNAIKYLCRANHKDNFERDIEKANYYIAWLEDYIYSSQTKEDLNAESFQNVSINTVKQLIDDN